MAESPADALVPALDELDIFDPVLYGRSGPPHDVYARLRKEDPVHWQDEPPVLGWPAGPGYWAVMRHHDCQEVLRQPQRFSSQLGATQIRDPHPLDLAFVRRMMLNLDPPEHSRLRTLVNKGFTRTNVRRLEQQIGARAEALVDRVAGQGEADFVTDVAADMPLMSLAEVLGVPASDRMLLYDWANRVIGYQDVDYAVSDAFDPAAATPMAAAAHQHRVVPGSPRPDGRPYDPRSREALVDMFAYAHALAAWKREREGDDVMSVLLRAEHEGRGITPEEFENLFFLFAVAGNETLRNGIPGGLYALLTHPDQHRKLLQDPSRLPTAAEEMLRWWTPVIHFRRTAAEDTTLGGKQLKRGDKVVVYFASANRDEEVFPDSDHFDIGREPNDHLSFGLGPHFCLGAHLARLQMQALFRAALWRLPDLELAGEPERLTSNFQQGFKHLPVRWTPATG
jgi:cytochrome P450